MKGEGKAKGEDKGKAKGNGEGKGKGEGEGKGVGEGVGMDNGEGVGKGEWEGDGCRLQGHIFITTPLSTTLILAFLSARALIPPPCPRCPPPSARGRGRGRRASGPDEDRQTNKRPAGSRAVAGGKRTTAMAFFGTAGGGLGREGE
jgi:hypothetical protein